MNVFLGPIRWLGATAISTLRTLAEVFGLLYGACAVLVFTRFRGFRIVLQITVQQTLFTGVHALPIVSLASLALGSLIISQVQGLAGGVINAADISAHVFAVEVLPLVVAVIILGRSGTAMCVELANMKLAGELDALRAMGVPLEHVIVLPRLLAGVISGLMLTVYGFAVGLGGGYWLVKSVGSLPFAVEALLNAVREEELIKTLIKVFFFSVAIVLVSIREGYSVEASPREVPQATTRAVVRSMALVFVLNTLISVFL
ncbi:MAG: ABC transporter permease [Planctomycetes bacterium]|nr:ABC transporter permease [Planctomycetota bacterium]